MLREAANTRREILTSLSSAMKEEVKRLIEPAFLRRARGAISRAMTSLEYRLTEDGRVSVHRRCRRIDLRDARRARGALSSGQSHPAANEANRCVGRKNSGSRTCSSLRAGAIDDQGTRLLPTGLKDAMRLLVLSSEHARPDTTKDSLGAVIQSWPAGQRMRLSLRDDNGQRRVGSVQAS